MLSRKIYKSFRFALSGLNYCIKNERNFRIHLLAMLTVALISPYYRFTAAQMVLLTLVISLVIISEMLNTAIEAAIDLFISEYNELAETAKDVSAGAVLVSAFCAALCGVYMFLDLEILHNIFIDISGSPLKIGITLIYITAGYLFVRGFDKK